MDSQRLTNWIQLFTAIAVIGGLALVVYELRQSKDLVQAQIVAEAMTRGADLERAKMGEDPRSALVKATFYPEELTEEEAITLDGYFMFITMTWQDMWLSEQIAGIDRRWRDTVPGMAKVVFASEPGIRWFEVHEKTLPPEISAVAREAISSNKEDPFKDRIDAILGNKQSSG